MDTLQDLLTKVYNDYVGRVYKVYDIFINQFGESNVDIQDVFPKPELPDYITAEDADTERDLRDYVIGKSNVYCNIYVHWGHLRITNEYDKYTELKDLWARVKVYYDGRIVDRFTLNRSNYSYLHISNGYMHSHVSSIPFSDFTMFQVPCTGSGPINHTIGSLIRKYNEDLWELFCCELNNYVTVESIEGVPYHRLELLGKDYSGWIYNFNTINTHLDYAYKTALSLVFWKEFVKEAIETIDFKFSYSKGAYHMGMSPAECTILISNVFIKWFNREHNRLPATVNLGFLLDKGILTKGIYQGGIIYGTGRHQNHDYSSYIGRKVLTFKGKDILLSIDGLKEASSNFSYFLTPSIINFIITLILEVVNYRYGRECAKTCDSQSTERLI